MMGHIDRYLEKFTDKINRIDNKYARAFSRGFVQGIDFIPICVERATNYRKSKFEYKPLTLGDKAYHGYIEDKDKNIFTASIEAAGTVVGVVSGSLPYCIPWSITGALDLANCFQRKSQTE